MFPPKISEGIRPEILSRYPSSSSSWDVYFSQVFFSRTPPHIPSRIHMGTISPVIPAGIFPSITGWTGAGYGSGNLLETHPRVSVGIPSEIFIVVSWEIRSVIPHGHHCVV